MERLVFPDWSPKTFEGVPFALVDPESGRVPNVVLLYGPDGKFPPQMPRSVELACNATAKAIHFLSGVSGWGYPYGTEGQRLDDRQAALRRRLGRGPPAGKRRPLRGLYPRGGRARLEARLPACAASRSATSPCTPKKHDVIERIELVKGPDQSAPIVMAVTVEVGRRNVRPGGVTTVVRPWFGREPLTSHVSAIPPRGRAHARGWGTSVPSEPRTHVRGHLPHASSNLYPPKLIHKPGARPCPVQNATCSSSVSVS